MNIQSYLLLALVVLLVACAIFYLNRKRRNGGGCSCGCQGCALSYTCHKKV